MKTNQKTRIFMIGGGRFLTPPDRQETNVSSWSHGRFLTPPDRQAPTSYKKGSSRNKCFFMIRGGRFLTPPDRQDFATGDISIIFPKVEWKLWSGIRALATLVSLKPLPSESSAQKSFKKKSTGLELFLWFWWGENFYSHIFPLDFGGMILFTHIFSLSSWWGQFSNQICPP